MRVLLAIVSLFSMQSRAECVFETDEPEHLSWELGTPDNIEPVEIIYESDAQSPEQSSSLSWYRLPEGQESFEPEDE